MRSLRCSVSGAADHLRAHEPSPVPAPPLAPKRLHAHTRHRGKDDACQDLDAVDSPGCPQIYLHRAGKEAKCLLIAVLRRRYHARSPRRPFLGRAFFWVKEAIDVKEVRSHRGLQEAEGRDPVFPRPTSAERSQTGSASRASSVTSARTPSTTTRRTSKMPWHRIAQLEERLLAARVIDKKVEISKDVVSVGSKVRRATLRFRRRRSEYHIVGSAGGRTRSSRSCRTSRPSAARSSGRRRARTVEVSTPKGKR